MGIVPCQHFSIGGGGAGKHPATPHLPHPTSPYKVMQRRLLRKCWLSHLGGGGHKCSTRWHIVRAARQ